MSDIKAPGTVFEPISVERAGEIAHAIITLIYARRGLDLRKNKLRECVAAKAQAISCSPQSLEGFVHEVLIPYVAEDYCGQINPLDVKPSFQKKIYNEIALRLLCAEEELRLSDLPKTVEEYSRRYQCGTKDEITSLIVHHLFPWHINKLVPGAERIDISVLIETVVVNLPPPVTA